MCSGKVLFSAVTKISIFFPKYTEQANFWTICTKYVNCQLYCFRPHPSYIYIFIFISPSPTPREISPPPRPWLFKTKNSGINLLINFCLISVSIELYIKHCTGTTQIFQHTCMKPRNDLYIYFALAFPIFHNVLTPTSNSLRSFEYFFGIFCSELFHGIFYINL